MLVVWGLGLALLVMLDVAALHVATEAAVDIADLSLELDLDVDSDEEPQEDVRVADGSALLVPSRGSTRVFTMDSNPASLDETEPPFRPPIV